jgi:hypothetical protein
MKIESLSEYLVGGEGQGFGHSLKFLETPYIQRYNLAT